MGEFPGTFCESIQVPLNSCVYMWGTLIPLHFPRGAFWMEPRTGNSGGHAGSVLP